MGCPGLHCPGCGGGWAETLGVLGFMGGAAYISYRVYEWITSPAVMHAINVTLEIALITVSTIAGIAILAGITKGVLYIRNRRMMCPVQPPQNEMLFANSEQLPSTIITDEGIEAIETAEISGVHVPLFSTRRSVPIDAYPDYNASQILLDGLTPDVAKKKAKFTLRRD